MVFQERHEEGVLEVVSRVAVVVWPSVRKAQVDLVARHRYGQMAKIERVAGVVADGLGETLVTEVELGVQAVVEVWSRPQRKRPASLWVGCASR